MRLADRGFTQAQIAGAFGTLPLVNDVQRCQIEEEERMCIRDKLTDM
jgi:hypothetical protein